jgi:uncharacterized membrane protein YhdT
LNFQGQVSRSCFNGNRLLAAANEKKVVILLHSQNVAHYLSYYAILFYIHFFLHHNIISSYPYKVTEKKRNSETQRAFYFPRWKQMSCFCISFFFINIWVKNLSSLSLMQLLKILLNSMMRCDDVLQCGAIECEKSHFLSLSRYFTSSS